MDTPIRVWPLVGLALVTLLGCGARQPPVSTPTPAPTTAPAVAKACDMRLFHRWEVGKVAENCMSAKACVLDQRLTDLSCQGHPDPAACMQRCLTAGVGFIAKAYQVEPPDFGTCLPCLAEGYAQMVQACGPQCPPCPADSPDDAKCRACVEAGRFFAGCLE